MSKREPIRAVKGMRDILPPESALWCRIEDAARAVFRAYNYQEIRTPIVEPTALFVRSVGEETDIVGKEMYTWNDYDKDDILFFIAFTIERIATTAPQIEDTANFTRSVTDLLALLGKAQEQNRFPRDANTQLVIDEIRERNASLESGHDPVNDLPVKTRIRDLILRFRFGQSLSLRPEATASVMRAYIEHRLDQRTGVKKFFYMGPMFRRERPQKGRYRQFFQIGAEAIGSESAVIDAEIIEMLVDYLGQLGVSGYNLLVNSVGCRNCRPAYDAALRQALAEVKMGMCGDCQRRADTNPMRVLDCKVPADQPVIEALPTLAGSLCDGCRAHFAEVQALLDARKISYAITPRLVRGLDYYTRTTFEFVHGSLGAQNTLLGGGRYDGLSEDLGGPAAPGIGFSIGEDRLVLTLQDAAKDQPAAVATLPLYIAWMGEAACRRAVALARKVRDLGVAVEVAADSVKLKRSLEIASKIGAQRVLIIGDQELADGRYQLKNMANGEQRGVSDDEMLAIFAQPLNDPEVCATESDKGTTP